MIHQHTVKAGRPDKEAAQLLGLYVIDIADQLFIENGYAGTSMAAIAVRARIGKQTLYRRYPDKAALFRDVISRRINKLIHAVEDEHIDDPVCELKAWGLTALINALDPEFVTLNRIVIAEASLFPELASLAADCWRSVFINHCGKSIQKAQDAGLLIQGDPSVIANAFLWGLVGAPLHQALICGQPLIGKNEFDDYFEVGWQMFMHGLAARDAYNLAREKGAMCSG
jgi:AcrR family transcriptional regulator